MCNSNLKKRGYMKTLLLVSCLFILVGQNSKAETAAGSEKQVRAFQGYYKSNNEGSCPREFSVAKYGDDQIMLLANDYHDVPHFNLVGYFDISQVNQASKTRQVHDQLAGFFIGWQTTSVVLKNDILTYVSQSRNVFGVVNNQLTVSMKLVADGKLLVRLTQTDSLFTPANEAICQFTPESK